MGTWELFWIEEPIFIRTVRNSVCQVPKRQPEHSHDWISVKVGKNDRMTGSEIGSRSTKGHSSHSRVNVSE